MLFSSMTFLWLFQPGVFIIHCILPPKARNAFLLLASLSYKIEGYKDGINMEMTETVQQSNLNFSKFESDRPDSRTVLFIGDSFLAGTEPYLSKDFKTTLFVHRSNYELLDRDLIKTEKPDIVVFQTAERFIDSYGYFMDMYAERVGE